MDIEDQAPLGLRNKFSGIVRQKQKQMTEKALYIIQSITCKNMRNCGKQWVQPLDPCIIKQPYLNENSTFQNTNGQDLFLSNS